MDNYEKMNSELKAQLQDKDMHNIAYEFEYKVLCNTKVANKYKFDMSKLVRNLLKCFNFLNLLINTYSVFYV